jgi:hypothetical protein
VFVPAGYSLYHAPVRDAASLMSVTLGTVVTHVVNLDFAKSRITLNIEFILSWKVCS